MGREFILRSNFEPAGDQPQAIGELLEGIRAGEAFQTLLGVTGSGKTGLTGISKFAAATVRKPAL